MVQHMGKRDIKMKGENVIYFPTLTLPFHPGVPFDTTLYIVNTHTHTHTHTKTYSLLLTAKESLCNSFRPKTIKSPSDFFSHVKSSIEYGLVKNDVTKT